MSEQFDRKAAEKALMDYIAPELYDALRAALAEIDRLAEEIARFKRADLTEVPFTEAEVMAKFSRTQWAQINDLASSHEILRAIAQGLDAKAAQVPSLVEEAHKSGWEDCLLGGRTGLRADYWLASKGRTALTLWKGEK